MPKSKDDPREFQNESLRNCPMDREAQLFRRLGEIEKAKDRGTAKIAEYFSGIPADLLTGLPEAIKSLPGKLDEEMLDILAGAQQALEMRDSEEED